MKLTIEENNLKIELKGFEIFLSLKKRFIIPLSNIVSVKTESPAKNWFDGMKITGAHLPGLIKSGSFSTKRGREYWNYTRGKGYLTLELKDEKFANIVLGLNDNMYWADMIRARIR